jgi:predicted transcriptional regulator
MSVGLRSNPFKKPLARRKSKSARLYPTPKPDQQGHFLRKPPSPTISNSSSLWDPTMTAKESAKNVLDRLPDKATWDNILYELHGRQKIEAGLNDVEAGRTVSHDQVKSRLAEYVKQRT